MKKLLIFSVAFVTMLLVTVRTNAQPPWAKAYGKKNKEWKEHHKHGRDNYQSYYYYPTANVYYNPVRRTYWYPRNGVWISVGVLPANIVVVNQPRYDVYYDGDEVWRDNSFHCQRYKAPTKVVVVNAPRRPEVSVDIHARF